MGSVGAPTRPNPYLPFLSSPATILARASPPYSPPRLGHLRPSQLPPVVASDAPFDATPPAPRRFGFSQPRSRLHHRHETLESRTGKLLLPRCVSVGFMGFLVVFNRSRTSSNGCVLQRFVGAVPGSLLPWPQGTASPMPW